MKIALFTDLARSAFRRPVTERYPFEKRPAPLQYRGRLTWSPEGCTGSPPDAGQVNHPTTGENAPTAPCGAGL